ncbi:MAG: hypothetical protein OEY89_13485 [Gammaproteobacteria bacterium]|nr:hypothetical protein [Gammaproteobacteria bacterium]
MEEYPTPHFLFKIDGSDHFVESETGCCGSNGKECPKCEGFMHYEGVHGGQIYKCEKCLYEDG